MSLLALALFACSATAGSALTLCAKGRSPYIIVIAANAPPSERYAASELQGYLEKIAGAKLPIVNDAERPASHEILLGENSHLQKLRSKIDFYSLGTEGFVLRTDRNRLIIAGGKPRGTLYGVYELLEDKLGVRWFTPEVESVPTTNRLTLPVLAERHLPALEYREVFWTEMMRNADFAARRRLNGDHYQLTEKHGGQAVVYFPFVHSMDSLVPRKLYSEHPEYFPLINGERKSGYVQRCLSNPDVLKLAIAKVREWLKEHPEATIISVSQNDTGNWCQCPECKALDDEQESPAASLIRFVNAVAADIEQDYPKVRIDTLAYQYTRKPPRTVRPRQNVIIRLCSIECCFAHPLATCDSQQNQRFRADILAWEPVAPKLYVWDYTSNFSHYQQPFPNIDVLQPNVRFFVEHGVKGLFEEGNYSPGTGEMGPLRSYLLAELLWHPDADMPKLTAEFLRGYYGPAAPKLQAYLDVLQAQVRDGKTHAHISDSPRTAYLNDQLISAADQLLNDAHALGDLTIQSRVDVAHLPIWYTRLVTGRLSEGAREERLRQFMDVARGAGITHISEGRSLDDWAKSMTAK
jgi:hypothetical protein